jgi:hypothetical protein
MNRKLFALALISAFTAALIVNNGVHAASSKTWIGGGDGANFSDPLNWEGEEVPENEDNLIFRNPSSARDQAVNDIPGLIISQIFFADKLSDPSSDLSDSDYYSYMVDLGGATLIGDVSCDTELTDDIISGLGHRNTRSCAMLSNFKLGADITLSDVGHGGFSGTTNLNNHNLTMLSTSGKAIINIIDEKVTGHGEIVYRASNRISYNSYDFYNASGDHSYGYSGPVCSDYTGRTSIENAILAIGLYECEGDKTAVGYSDVVVKSGGSFVLHEFNGTGETKTFSNKIIIRSKAESIIVFPQVFGEIWLPNLMLESNTTFVSIVPIYGGSSNASKVNLGDMDASCYKINYESWKLEDEGIVRSNGEESFFNKPDYVPDAVCRTPEDDGDSLEDGWDGDGYRPPSENLPLEDDTGIGVPNSGAVGGRGNLSLLNWQIVIFCLGFGLVAIFVARRLFRPKLKF